MWISHKHRPHNFAIYVCSISLLKSYIWKYTFLLLLYLFPYVLWNQHFCLLSSFPTSHCPGFPLSSIPSPWDALLVHHSSQFQVFLISISLNSLPSFLCNPHLHSVHSNHHNLLPCIFLLNWPIFHYIWLILQFIYSSFLFLNYEQQNCGNKRSTYAMNCY